MSLGQLFGLSANPVRRAISCWMLRRRLAHEEFNTEFFSNRITHDTVALKDSHYRQVALRSELRRMERQA